MKFFDPKLFLSAFLLVSVGLQAQTIRPLHETKWPESNPDKSDRSHVVL